MGPAPPSLLSVNPFVRSPPPPGGGERVLPIRHRHPRLHPIGPACLHMPTQHQTYPPRTPATPFRLSLGLVPSPAAGIRHGVRRLLRLRGGHPHPRPRPGPGVVVEVNRGREGSPGLSSGSHRAISHSVSLLDHSQGHLAPFGIFATRLRVTPMRWPGACPPTRRSCGRTAGTSCRRSSSFRAPRPGPLFGDWGPGGGAGRDGEREGVAPTLPAPSPTSSPVAWGRYPCNLSQGYSGNLAP